MATFDIVDGALFVYSEIARRSAWLRWNCVLAYSRSPPHNSMNRLRISQRVVCVTNTWSIGSRKSQACTQACQRHYPFAMDLYFINDAAAPMKVRPYTMRKRGWSGSPKAVKKLDPMRDKFQCRRCTEGPIGDLLSLSAKTTRISTNRPPFVRWGIWRSSPKPFWIWKHIHVHKVHVYEVYAREVHAYELHAREVHAPEIHAHGGARQ
jgi:hypothetical protein